VHLIIDCRFGIRAGATIEIQLIRRAFMGIEGATESLVHCTEICHRNRRGQSKKAVPVFEYHRRTGAVLEARRAGELQKQQEHIAVQCEILLRGFARVGIIALIDEATGYQRDRTRDSLARILEAFIAKELQPWVRTFPAEYYQEMFRLRGLEYKADSVKRPPYFGHLTNDIVYDRLAPEVLEQLKLRIPRNEAGRPTAKFSQMLTRNTGYPKLREHLDAVVATMRLSSGWHDFKAKLDRNYKRYSGPTQTAFDFGDDDEGKGI